MNEIWVPWGIINTSKWFSFSLELLKETKKKKKQTKKQYQGQGLSPKLWFHQSEAEYKSDVFVERTAAPDERLS